MSDQIALWLHWRRKARRRLVRPLWDTLADPWIWLALASGITLYLTF